MMYLKHTIITLFKKLTQKHKRWSKDKIMTSCKQNPKKRREGWVGDEVSDLDLWLWDSEGWVTQRTRKGVSVSQTDISLLCSKTILFQFLEEIPRIITLIIPLHDSIWHTPIFYFTILLNTILQLYHSPLFLFIFLTIMILQ